MRGNTETCPICGALCASPEGTFRLGDQLISAVRRSGVTKEQVKAFRDTAQSVADGKTGIDDAASQLEGISTAFATILRATNQNAPALGVLIALLTLLVSCYSLVVTMNVAAISHADAQSQLQVAREQANASGTPSEAADDDPATAEQLAMLRADVDRLNALSQQSTGLRQPKPAMTRISLSRTQGAALFPNRHERRKRARQQRKEH